MWLMRICMNLYVGKRGREVSEMSGGRFEIQWQYVVGQKQDSIEAEIQVRER